MADGTAMPPHASGRTDPFVELVDVSHHREVVRRRAAAREAADRAQDLVTVRAAVEDLAEARGLVSVRLQDGRDLAGTLVGAGSDHLVLHAGERTTLVRLAPIASIVSTQLDPDRAPAVGFSVDRDPNGPCFDVGAPLLDVLADLRTAVNEVVVGSLGRTEALRGRLQAVGVDMLVLALSGRVRAVVAVDALTDVSWSRR